MVELFEGGTSFLSLGDSLCGSHRGLLQALEKPGWRQSGGPQNSARSLRRLGFQSQSAPPALCVTGARSWQRSADGGGSLSQSPGNTPPRAHPEGDEEPHPRSADHTAPSRAVLSQPLPLRVFPFGFQLLSPKTVVPTRPGNLPAWGQGHNVSKQPSPSQPSLNLDSSQSTRK